MHTGFNYGERRIQSKMMFLFEAYLRVRVSFVLSNRARRLVEGVHQPQVFFVKLMAVHHDGS